MIRENRPAMKQVHLNRTIVGMHRSLGTTIRLFVPALVMMVLAACSAQHDPQDDLAVAKMPVSEMQATNFLPLNSDKPGTNVDVRRYLVPGKYNLVCFFSPFDGTYVNLEPALMRLSQIKTEVAVRVVNVNRPDVQGIDWQSQIVQAMGLQTLPYYIIFDPAGNLRAQGRPAQEQVNQWVRELQNANPVNP